jgi:dihydrolipoamide dehydrogenase
MRLAHEAMREGKVAAEVIAGRPAAFDARAVPAVVYTDPQIAWCGLTEAQAREQGCDLEIVRFPWHASGRALFMGAPDGLTKLMLEPGTGRVLGMGAVGRGAEGLVAEGMLAVEMGALAEDLALGIHPHPTLSETLGRRRSASSAAPRTCHRPDGVERGLALLWPRHRNATRQR